METLKFRAVKEQESLPACSEAQKYYWIGTLRVSGAPISRDAKDPPLPEFKVYGSLEEADYALDEFLRFEEDTEVREAKDGQPLPNGDKDD